MTVFVDTGVFYAHHDRDASRHEAAKAAMDAVLDGTHGQPYTSDYVVDEAVTLARRRTGEFDASWTLAERILGRDRFPSVVEIRHVTREVFGDAVDIYRQYGDHDLSFTDATILALCEREGFDAVLSFDDDFDGLVDRIDPSTHLDADG